jgi:uncharacterized protein (DUF4415 family)
MVCVAMGASFQRIRLLFDRHREDLASGRIETKSGTYVKLDRDVLRFFKAKAPRRNAAPDQNQINEALRAFICRARNTS